MANVKTAISIEKPLFDEVEALAEEMKVSRSRVFTLAVKHFVEEQKNRKLLEAINAAYEPPTEDERDVLEQIRESQRRLIDKW